MRWSFAALVLVARTAVADPPPPPHGLVVGGMVGIVHVDDKTDMASMTGTGPILEAHVGWWLTSWLAGSLAGAFWTIGTDLPYTLSDGSHDHLRQYDLSLGLRFMLRVNEAFAFGPGVGAVWDDQKLVGLSTSWTSRFYDITVALTPTYIQGHPLEIILRASYAPFSAGQYPEDNVVLGVGMKL